jgi:Leucine-rich repeat (LRR) protein
MKIILVSFLISLVLVGTVFTDDEFDGILTTEFIYSLGFDEESEYIYLDSRNITTIPAGTFENFIRLNRLFLDYNELTELPSGMFDGLTNLTILTLDYNKIVSIEPGAFRDLIILEQLFLADNLITELVDDTFITNANLSRNGYWSFTHQRN